MLIMTEEEHDMRKGPVSQAGTIVIAVLTLCFLPCGIYGITPEEVIKLRQAGISEETIQKLIDAETKSEKEEQTCTVVFVMAKFTMKTDIGAYPGLGRVYKKWDKDFCRLDGMSFPREYKGKLLTVFGTYHDERVYGRYDYIHTDYSYQMDLDIFTFELEPGRHVFLLPNDKGNYESKHVVTKGDTGLEEHLVVSAPNSYVFQLAPGEIRFFEYDQDRKSGSIRLEESLEAILRRSENILMLKRRLEHIFGMDIVSGITNDHNARRRGYDILPALKEKDKSTVTTEYSDYASMYLGNLNFSIYEEHVLVPYLISRASGSPGPRRKRERLSCTTDFEERVIWELEEGNYSMRFYGRYPREYRQFMQTIDKELQFSVRQGKTTVIRFNKNDITVSYK
jgi:hypothetical protein